MGKALYRKYRSRSLDEIVGQEHVTTILKNAIAQDRIGHAYLFTGPRGVGKTSIARILAHEINKLPYSDESTHLDIIEIDAASNNGVDDIRDLREKVGLAPTSALKKIYIIDEVHMLSKPAFNALLKTLEEPPDHVVFILATTDFDKLPDTIVSRTQRYAFKLASEKDIVTNLKKIAKAENINITDTALSLVAEHSSGSYRDSVSLLDQLASITAKEITAENVEASLGLASHTAIEALLVAISSRDFEQSIQLLKNMLTSGIQPTIIATQMIQVIQSSLDTHHELLSLTDTLIAVRQSAMPEALLIATIGLAAIDNTKQSLPSVPAVVTKKLASIEIPALVKKATQAHPKNDKVKPLHKEEANTATPEPPSTPISTDSSLDWNTILSDTSSLSIGLRTVLTKCSLADDGDRIVTIFSRNEFYKKKLDTPKYRQELFTLLLEKTSKEWDFVIRPEQAPSKNQTVANVAAIMGGGEEVNLEG